MKFIGLIPKIFYEDIEVGLELFRDGLGFTVVHDDRGGQPPFCILKRDATKLHLVEDARFARGDRPEIRLETDDIEALHHEVDLRASHLMHPNGRTVTLKPWGLREFAVRDKTSVCVIVEQAPNHREAQR
jgi:hypothetical protein